MLEHQKHDTLFIDGAWVVPHGRGTIEVIHATTEASMGTIPAGNAVDAQAAVAAARRAQAGWASLPVQTRAAYLDKIALGLKARSEELAMLIASEVGMPIKLARAIQVAGPIAQWESYARILREYAFEERIGNSLVLKEPVGVVAAITPWNYPLNQITPKVAAAMAAGCTVVLKPSEVAPLNAFVLAEVIERAGVPAGVFNLVTGFGPVVGEALVQHAEVDMISFTGSTQAGKRISELAAQSVKRVALELGGKSAAVILEDADLAAAVKGTLNSCLLNSGQTCSAHTRMLVPESRYQEACAIAAQLVARFVPGDPLLETTRLGPLISAQQRERVRSYIKKALEEGAELIAGGPETPPEMPKGFFVQPTVLGNVETTHTAAREEIFGPVLSIIRYRDEEDAIRIANDSMYGLSGGVWSANEAHAIAVARRIRTGQVDINGGAYNAAAPFGGVKQSGHGRENGVYGFAEFLELKSLQLPKNAS